MKDMYAYMTPGIVSFKAYPDAMTGRSGTVFDAVRSLATDDFFGGIEIGWIHNWQERDRVAKLLRTTELEIAYATQPRTIREGLDLNALDERERRASVEAIEDELDAAHHLGASRARLLAGPDPGDERREEAKAQLVASIEELAEYAASLGDITLTLKIFDRDVEKRCLVGTFEDTRDVASAVASSHDNFGVLVDLSHFPLLGVTPEESIPLVEEWATDFHIGTCVLEPDHPAYGDKQPRFGIEHSQNDTQDVADFFSLLLERGLLDTEDRPMVSVEVVPLLAEDRSEVVVANAKRVWRRAWAMATTD